MAAKKKGKLSGSSEPKGDLNLLYSAHQIWLAGLGAMSRAQAGAPRIFDDLMREGSKLQGGALDAAQKVVMQAFQGAQKTVNQRVDTVKEQATAKLPGHANAWYLLAFVLGRYAQRVSIIKALAEGIGGKVHDSLERCIELEPKHADAHIALGLYHAEIIDKVGALAGRLTYGADAAKSVKYFEQALKLNPGSAIAHMEFANGLLMLHGDKQKARAIELYRKAASCKPADAMERLDVEQARVELE